MSTLAITYTFVAGNVIRASEHNQNNTDIVTWANGNVTNTNLGTMSGTVTWTVSTNSNAISITNTGTEGSILVAHNATLASTKSAVKITSNAAQAAGNAIVEINSSSASSNVPALLVTDAGAGPSVALQVVSTTKGSIPAPKMTTTQKNAITTPVAGTQVYDTTLSNPAVYTGSWKVMALDGAAISKTANYTVTPDDRLILADSSGGAFNLTLPTSSGSGKTYRIKKTESSVNAVTVLRAGSDVIVDDSSSVTSTTLNSQGEDLEIADAASGTWQVMNRRIPSNWNSSLTFTPNSGAFTVTSTSFFSRRVGDSMEVRGYFVWSASAGGDSYITLPTGYAVDTAKIQSTLKALVGDARVLSAGAATAFDPRLAIYFDASQTARVYITSNGASNIFAALAGSNIAAAAAIGLTFSVPISGWKG